MKKIILASASPRRKKLLQQLGLSFEVIASDIEERTDPRMSPPEIVRSLAAGKAEDVASGVSDALVIGADTVVVLENSVLEKPRDKAEAFGMLHRLSGKTHRVLTGVALLETDPEQNIIKQHTFSEQTEVIFGPLDEKDIRNYIETGRPMDKAGGYGIQDEFGAVFVKGINGDYYNVVGFPLYRFYRKMKSFAPECLQRETS